MANAVKHIAGFQFGPNGAINAPALNENLLTARALTTVGSIQARTITVGATPTTIGSGLAGYLVVYIDDTANPQPCTIVWSATNIATSTTYTVTAVANAISPYITSFTADTTATVTISQTTSGTTQVRIYTFTG